MILLELLEIISFVSLSFCSEQTIAQRRTYMSMVDDFVIKAKYSEYNLDWKRELDPLFTLNKNISDHVIEIKLQSLNIDITVAINDALSKIPKNTMTANIQKDVKEIMSDQWKVNELSTDMIKQISHAATAARNFSNCELYEKYEMKLFSDKHLNDVFQNLNTMQEIHAKIFDIFQGDLDEVDAAKKAFKEEIMSLFDFKKSTQELQNAISIVKKKQGMVWSNLQLIEQDLKEYYKQRDEWAYFLMEFKDKITADPLFLKKRKRSIWGIVSTSFKRLFRI